MPEDDQSNRPNRKSRTPGPTREGDSLADVVELLLDKGVVINADIAVSVGETELLGIHIRAALASFDTAAKYGLQFPDGTDARRIEEASGRKPLDEGEEGDDVGDGAPISVRSPSREGVSARPDDEDDENPDTAAEAVEEVAETVAGEESTEESEGDGDESVNDESESDENDAGEGSTDENSASDEGDDGETAEADDAD